MIENHLVKYNIPLEKLDDIALVHYRLVESQRHLKRMNHQVERKGGTSKINLPLHFKFIFPEIPDKFECVKVEMFTSLHGDIPQEYLKLWKEQKEFRLQEMFNRIPDKYPKSQHLKQVLRIIYH